MSVREQTLEWSLPKPTDHPSFFEASKQFSPLVCDKHTPTKLEDWLFSDRPQLCIYAVSFTDSTLLIITLVHTLIDDMGLATFLAAWSAVLRGQEDEAPDFLGFDEDPLRYLTNGYPGSTPESNYLSGKMLKGFSNMKFAFHFMLEVWWFPQQTRIIFLPGKYIQDLREAKLLTSFPYRE